MGRPKTYDREDVTRKAMQLFWARGYEATSTKALAEHMGMMRGTAYWRRWPIV